jgi:hypothetical protein
VKAGIVKTSGRTGSWVKSIAACKVSNTSNAFCQVAARGGPHHKARAKERQWET